MDLKNIYLLKSNFINKAGRVNGNYNYILKNNPHLLDVLNKEFNGLSIKESLYLLSHNLSEPPKCPICNNYIKFNGRNYNKTCSKECANILNVINNNNTKLERYGNQYYNNRLKMKETKLERYGDSNYVNSNKAKQTKLERYGDSNYVNSNKAKQTKLERYGDSNYVNKEKAIKTKIKKYGSISYYNISKMKETKLERYGNSNYVNSNKAKQTKLEKYGDPYYNNRLKAKQTMLLKYGVENFTQSKEWQKIIQNEKWQEHRKLAEYNTKKKHHTFNTSKPEEDGYKLLYNKFGFCNVKRQYKSDLYPFACDFYIKSLNLYIEFNLFWTHGGHRFDPNNKYDIKKLNEWKLRYKKSNYTMYDCGINVWTKSDPLKFAIAEKNNLNYLAFYTYKEFLNWINER